MTGWSVTAAAEPGDALIRVPGRADLATRDNMVIRVHDLGDGVHRPQSITHEGNDLILRVGPDITEHLFSGTHYDIALPNAGAEELVGNVRWPKIVPRPRERIVYEPGRKRSDPPPAGPGEARPTDPSFTSPAQPLLLDPIRTPEIQPSVRPVRRRWLAAAVAGLALLAVAGAGVSWLLPRHAPPSPLSLQNSGLGGAASMEAGGGAALGGAPPTPLPEQPTGLSADPLASLSVADVIARAPNAAAIGHEGQSRLAAGKADDAVLLLEAAASRGDPSSMAQLARLYDPNGFNPKGPIPSPDIRESAQYYRDAEKAGDAAVEPARAKLHDMLLAQAHTGDQSAALALKDFWP